MVEEQTSLNNEALDQLRHSAAHLLAAAVLELRPGSKPTIGPAIDNGFYYDFDLSQPLSENDFVQLEQTMYRLVKSWDYFTRQEVSAEEAKQHFKDNEYKIELIEELENNSEQISLYRSGEFTDLCRGGHVDNPSELIKHFKLLSVAGAYWRGDENRPMLTRIYGTAYFTSEELAGHLTRIEEAKKRDHRKLGKELDLFTFSSLVGSGLPLYTPKGGLIRRLINQHVEEIQAKQGYEQVWTPQITKADLFKVSGHYDKYKDDMFKVTSNYSDEEMYLKPMNCPQHTQIYASKPRSYRDLPIRMTDFAMLYRDEKPGELSGLARVRAFSQDDCHIFCREDQVNVEIDRALTMTKEVMDTYGFSYRYRLSVRDPKKPEKYIGDPATWDKVEAWAEEIMERNQIDYYTGVGEAAFYAPKMDLMATDALGREWQLSTVQIDYFMPERFALTYIDSDGQEKRPVMLHRAIVGSPERFMMILIEHFAGAFPVWLSPVQAVVIPIGEEQLGYAQKVEAELTNSGIRAEVWDQESMHKRIRKAEKQRLPYMLVVGKKEADENLVSVRARGEGDRGQQPLEGFIGETGKIIAEKSLRV